MPPRSPSLVAGLRIGTYELVRRIGRGGMAEVWCARRISERRASKFVAIKVVADPHVGDPRYQRMFRAEAELSALLSHANIVQVFDEGEDGGRSYLVMEWVDGVNLLKIATALRYSSDDGSKHRIIAYIIGQLLHALSYAHGITLHDGNPLGIVHRDVSPQNVLVSNNGEVKLTDFGVAHHVLDESSGVHVKGKVRYMAPEQLDGRTRDPRVDLYAVGAILHELLDGRPFRHHVEDQREMYIEVLSGRVPSLARAVPPELDALRLSLLAGDPKDRVPTADAALLRLERFPGYGDARRELKQLCASLTGIMRPRVGPGTSQMEVMATPADVDATPDAPSPGPAASTDAHGVFPEATPDVSPEISESERPPSLTLRVLPQVPGVPEPVRNDTSPLPPVVPLERAPAPVDTSVITTATLRRVLEPSEHHGEVPSAPREPPSSSPGSTVVAPRRRSRGAMGAVLALVAVLLSLGMLGAFWMRDDAIDDPVEGRATPSEATALTVAPVAPFVGSGAPRRASHGDDTEDGSTSTAGTGGSTATDAAHSTSQSSDDSPPEDDEPEVPPVTKPPGKPKRPTVYSGLIVAVDGSEPLVVRVDGKKAVTIESRKSWPFRLPVGKAHRVRWQRKGEASWSEHRVDVRAKCELQLRIPSKKTMTLGACE